MQLKTIEKHIDAIRTLIKQVSDDTKYSDEFLYKEFIDQRAAILKQKLDDFKFFSRNNYKSFYMPLDKEYELDILEAPEGILCKLRMSKHPIPRSIASKLKDTLRVFTVEGVEIDRGSALEARLAEHSFTRKDKPMWDIVNEHLVIYRKLDLPGVVLEAVWEDPTELGVLPKYIPVGKTYQIDYTYDPLKDTIPMDSAYNSVVYEMVMKRMGISFQMPEDNANNSQSITTNQNQVK